MKLYDTKQVARFLDITERRVRMLRDEGIISEVAPGKYELIETNHRYINYLRKRNPDSGERIDYNTEAAGASHVGRNRPGNDRNAYEFQEPPVFHPVKACADIEQENRYGGNIKPYETADR